MSNESRLGDDEAEARMSHVSPFRIKFRWLFAITACLTFLVLVVGWFLNSGAPSGALASIVLPWIFGSFAGIAIMRIWNRSILLGSIPGGIVGLVLWYCACAIILYPPPINESLILLAFSVCGSGIIAGLVGVVGEGLSVRRDSKSRH